MNSEEIADGVTIQRHPLSMAGCKLGRVVTSLRLADGRTLVHSTASFSPEDVSSLKSCGEPSWLVEPTKIHDTCSAAGRAAFPEIPYLVPPTFDKATKLGSTLIGEAGSPWGEEIEVIELAGIPKLREHVFFHKPSRTLVVADLIFNLPESAGAWTRGLLRLVSGMKSYPATSRLFWFYTKDREALSDSLERMLEWDFERVVVGHGDPITVDAKAKVTERLVGDGFLIRR